MPPGSRGAVAALLFAICLPGCSGGGGAGSAALSAGPETAGPLLYAESAPSTNAATTTGPGLTSASYSFTALGGSIYYLVSETGYTGAFTVTEKPCASTLTGISATLLVGSGPTDVLSISPTAGYGPCTITIADSAKKSATVLINVTTTAGNIQ